MLPANTTCKASSLPGVRNVPHTSGGEAFWQLLNLSGAPVDLFQVGPCVPWVPQVCYALSVSTSEMGVSYVRPGSSVPVGRGRTACEGLGGLRLSSPAGSMDTWPVRARRWAEVSMPGVHGVFWNKKLLAATGIATRSKDATNVAPGLTTRNKKLLVTNMLLVDGPFWSSPQAVMGTSPNCLAQGLPILITCPAASL